MTRKVIKTDICTKKHGTRYDIFEDDIIIGCVFAQYVKSIYVGEDRMDQYLYRGKNVLVALIENAELIE